MRRAGETRDAASGSQQRTELAHPSTGGGEGYPPSYRQDAINAFAQGQGHLFTCSVSSARRWAANGSQRLAKTGNKPPSVLRGEHQFLLCLLRKIRPKSTAAEIRTFICQQSSDHAMFTDQQISKREKELGFTRKRSATSAEQAFTPRNRLRARLYWNTPYPTGILNTNRAQICDVDEFGLWVEKMNPSYGKTMRGVACVQPGKYGHGDKFSCIIGVMADGRRWFKMRKIAGTSSETFNSFVDDICNGPRALPALPQITFIWDNLSAHHSNLVLNTVHDAGHRITARAPYRPWDGPVEYVIHSIEQELSTRISHVTTDAQLCTEVHNIVTGLDGFDAYFVHCGY